ncbi:diguanylate cyclase response regulator [Desulfuromonas versatilis]|uniref:diguanylate cyclase n=1 Tax=Desulfuromonas versatilis TaxID=2802975 RepID=A0ABM8I0U5_9BACT|nr:diguanylate cyclase [Desulfuromonas versatilis]BCR06591.1 diguanylate cyclase response regulator [Desulfuromonas versatilis]
MSHTALVIDRSQPAGEIARIADATALFDLVFTCSNTGEAIERLQHHPVDLVLCNWQAEGMDQEWAFFQALKKREDWVDIPVFLFAEKIDDNLQVLALESGADDCLDYRSSTRQIAARMRPHLGRKKRLDALRSDKRSLAQMALTDGLTGLYNRAYFDAGIDSEIARSRRSGQPFSLLLIDLDHFKSVNDTYGHPVGDQVLQSVAKVLKDSSRESDLVCRYGGEEFAVILPGTPLAMSYRVAERIRRRVAELCPDTISEGLSVSVSIGVSGCDASRDLNSRQLLEEADCALYTSKRNGRNRTEIFRPAKAKARAERFPIYLGGAVGYA